jgi:hypothetical protein
LHSFAAAGQLLDSFRGAIAAGLLAFVTRNFVAHDERGCWA